MIQQIEEHITKVDAFTASTLDDVEKFRIAYLGKKGVLNDLFAAFKNVPNDQKKAFGQKLNELKQKTSSKIDQTGRQDGPHSGTRQQDVDSGGRARLLLGAVCRVLW